MELSEAQKKAERLKAGIELLCILEGLNLTVYDGGIGFVDQRARKIVMVWKPEYKMPENTDRKVVTQ